MKKLSLILIALLVFPAMLSAQYKVKAVNQEPVDLVVDIPGYNPNVAKASMNLNIEFDQATESLMIHMSKGLTSCPYDKVWLLQHEVKVSELPAYTKSRGVKFKKAKTFTDQENFLNLSTRTLNPSILCQGMTFSGVYDLKAPKKVKKQLDHQMVPLDGTMVLDLSFKVNNKPKVVVLTLRNLIPMNRKGSKGTAAFVADDITITIELGRCKDAEQMIKTIQEYENMFSIAEEKLIELKKSPSTMKSYKEFILRLYGEIDIDRFDNTGCDEIEASFDNLMEIMDRINEMGKTPVNPNNGGGGGTPPPCDVKKLNDEIKSTTTKLNNMVNDWSLAPDAATKAEKKASFEATYQRFDAKLNELPAGCKGKLDAKLLKNYEFVKKLVK